MKHDAAKVAEVLRCARSGRFCRSWADIGRHHDIPKGSFWYLKQVAFVEECRKIDAALAGIYGFYADNEVPDFVSFRLQCFGHETYPNQQEWVDAVESHDRALILVPPEHGKTFTWAIEYPVWRICKDPNVRIVLVCKNQEVAKKRLYAIKKRLSDHDWYENAKLRNPVAEWGPFEPVDNQRGSLPWTATLIYVSGVDSGEKDATVEALGVGNQIQGARADLIILDDIADLKNQQSESTRENILDWLGQEVNTRLSESGKIVMIGTRVHENDIYGTLLSEDTEWAADFAKVVQPAIIDEAAKTVVCPQMWPYDKLVDKRRNRMRLRNWNLVYQQQATGMPDAPFAIEALEAAKDTSYAVGQLSERVNVVMGVDPALAGTLAISVVKLDRDTGERWLIDCIARTEVRQPDIVKSLVLTAAQKYGAVRCRIEKNAMQGFFSNDLDLRRRLLVMGCQVEEEYTTAQNKYDPEWGVSSVAAQFDQGLWHLPWAYGSEPTIRPLIEELAAWRPGAKVKQDRVMSLWLAELSARQYGSYRPDLPRRGRVPGWVKQRGRGSLWPQVPRTATDEELAMLRAQPS